MLRFHVFALFCRTLARDCRALENVQDDRLLFLYEGYVTNSLLSTLNLSRELVEAWFTRADEQDKGAAAAPPGGRVALALFNTSFPLPLDVPTAMRDAGIETVAIETATAPALPTLAATIKSVGADLVLFSHPEHGAAVQLASLLTVPLLNAGDMLDENPVGAVLYAYAIRALRGPLSDLRIALLGNLKFSAEAHSLGRLLGLFGGRLSFVSPAALSMPYDLTDEMRLSAYEVEETNDLVTTLRKSDVLYLVGADPVRVEPRLYDKLHAFYNLAPETFAEARPDLLILGRWEGADELLMPARAAVQRAAGQMLGALARVFLE